LTFVKSAPKNVLPKKPIFQLAKQFLLRHCTIEPWPTHGQFFAQFTNAHCAEHSSGIFIMKNATWQSKIVHSAFGS
jgi:hypothetical protein